MKESQKNVKYFNWQGVEVLSGIDDTVILAVDFLCPHCYETQKAAWQSPPNPKNFLGLFPDFLVPDFCEACKTDIIGYIMPPKSLLIWWKMAREWNDKLVQECWDEQEKIYVPDRHSSEKTGRRKKVKPSRSDIRRAQEIKHDMTQKKIS